jgi:hypothetical protein
MKQSIFGYFLWITSMLLKLLAMTSCTFLQILNYPDNNLVKLLSAIKNYDTITIDLLHNLI